MPNKPLATLRCFVDVHPDHRCPTLECQLYVRPPDSPISSNRYIKTYRRTTRHHTPGTLVHLIVKDVLKKYELFDVDM
jgi:hypothetical protein